MRTSFLFAMATVAVGATFSSPRAEAQQPVLLRLGGDTGHPIRSRIVVTTFTRGFSAGHAVPDTLPSTRLTLYVTQILDRLSGDTASFTAVIDSVHGETPDTPGLSAGIDSVAQGGRGRFAFAADSRGGVISTDSPGEPVNAGTAARRLVGAAGPREGGFVLPVRPVRVGDTWADSTPMRRARAGQEIRTRRLFRLERLEAGGDSGIAVISMGATLTVQEPSGIAEVPSTGIARFDIAAHRVTAFAITTVFSEPTPAGPRTTRSETVRYELGETALPPP